MKSVLYGSVSLFSYLKTIILGHYSIILCTSQFWRWCYAVLNGPENLNSREVTDALTLELWWIPCRRIAAEIVFRRTYTVRVILWWRISARGQKSSYWLSVWADQVHTDPMDWPNVYLTKGILGANTSEQISVFFYRAWFQNTIWFDLLVTEVNRVVYSFVK